MYRESRTQNISLLLKLKHAATASVVNIAVIASIAILIAI